MSKPTEVYFTFFKRMKELGAPLHKVIDCGAFEGKWTERLKTFYPGAEVYLIDASEKHKDKLNSLGIFKQAYLADRQELRQFYYSESNEDFSGDSLYKENSNFPYKMKKVTTQRLCDVVPDQPYDLIKMDLQGAEIEVIDGSLELFLKTKWVQLECAVFDNNQGAPSFAQIVNYMTNSGFRVFDIENMYFNNRLMGIDLVFNNITLPKVIETEATSLVYKI